MQVQYLELDQIIPYEFNNRTHPQQQIDRIANSISLFGFNQPIVVDESNTILVGHGRWAAAKKLGMVKAPVLLRAGLSETDKRAYRILDNKLQNDSGWDYNNLELELGSLEDSGFDLKAWDLDSLLIAPIEAAFPDLGDGSRDSDYLRRFNLTQEQAEIVDRALSLAASVEPIDDGNRNAALLAAICWKYEQHS